MSLTTRITTRVEATHTIPLDLTTPTSLLDHLTRIDLADGTGADQANRIWHDTRTVNASSSDDIDLTAVLTDAFGATLTFARIKALLIRAAAGNGDVLNVGGDAAALVGWVADASDIVKVRPGGLLLLAAPDATAYASTATTADILQIANPDDEAATYDIVLIGASA
jgi:hypothetical protein